MQFSVPQGVNTAPQKQETAYERVLRTGVLRCAYVVLPPVVAKDPKTAELSGIMVDAIQAAAEKVNIKVEWTEEANWGNYLSVLQYGKADMVCAANWNNTAGEWCDHEAIGPLFYSGIGVWVRPDDERFNGNLAAINDPAIMISSIDGTIPGRITAVDFPLAKILSMPQTTDYSFNLLNVVEKNADITFVDNYQGNAFLQSNPGSLKNISAQTPVRIFPKVYLVRKGEHDLKTMFSSIFQDMINNGEIEKLLQKYEKYPNTFYRVAKPYEGVK